MSDPTSPARTHLLALAVLAALVALSLGASLAGDFVWDDAPLIVDNPLIQGSADVGEILTSSFWETPGRHDRFRMFFRPLVVLSYAADWAIWGPDPFGFHLTNLLLHFACSGLVFAVALQERLERWAALGAAGLFAVHPVHVESVAWISGRTDLLCAVFALAAFWVCRRPVQGAAAVAARVLALSLFACALFAKEMAATLPALIFLDRWLARPGPDRRWRAASLTALPFFIVLAVYLWVRSLVLGAGGVPLYSLGAEEFLATALFVVARYVTLLVMPLGLDAHYPLAPLDSLGSPLAIVGGLILLLLLCVGVFSSNRFPRTAYWIVWIFVALTPVMSFGRFGDVLMADRFLYLPSVGLALLAGRGVDFLSASATLRVRRATIVGCAVILAVLGAMTLARTRIWRSDLALFTDMVRTSPHSALVQNNLGLAHYHRGQYRTALESFERAVDLAPDYALAQNNLAAALEREGRLQDALQAYRRALLHAPDLAEAAANGGNLMVRQGEVAEGLQVLRTLVHRWPGYAPGHYALADALNRTGRTAEVLPILFAAIELAPGHAEPHYLAGKIFYEQGRVQVAAEHMSRFLELWSQGGEHAAVARRIVEEASLAR